MGRRHGSGPDQRHDRAKGIDELLETMLTVADLHEYMANPDRPAAGTCLEAEVQRAAAWWPRCWCRRARCAWAT